MRSKKFVNMDGKIVLLFGETIKKPNTIKRKLRELTIKFVKAFHNFSSAQNSLRRCRYISSKKINII